jgi:hypothetical protein
VKIESVHDVCESGEAVDGGDVLLLSLLGIVLVELAGRSRTGVIFVVIFGVCVRIMLIELARESPVLQVPIRLAINVQVGEGGGEELGGRRERHPC